MKNFLKKHWVKFLVGAIIIALIIAIPFIFTPSEETGALNSYKMTLAYNDENKTISGQEEVLYCNNSNNAFSSIFFNLYPNAFREGATSTVVSSSNFNEAFPNGASYGSIEVTSVTDSKGNALEFKLGGEDENILEVVLPEPLYPDESVTVVISFSSSLPNANHRYGYGENTINIGNFYPIACVYEDGVGFFTKPYHSNGDPFYSDVANYEVELTVPNNFTVVASGARQSSSGNGANITYNFAGQKIRDFCIVLSEKFEMASCTVGSVTVNYYGYSGDGDLQENADFAGKCVETYNKLFGAYPYSVLNVVKANFVHGGMEYPNLVLISDSAREEDYNYVIAHEIAHQWWYGVVGTNQYQHAWIDEGLAEYSTYLFFEENSQYGLSYNNMISNALSNYKFFVQVYERVNGQVDTSMDRALDQFATEPEYVQLTYTKGVLLFDNLRETLGERKFMKALSDLYEEYAYKNINSAEFIACFSSSAGRNLENLIKSWINGTVVIA